MVLARFRRRGDLEPSRYLAAWWRTCYTTYNPLDLAAKGCDENPESTQDWVRYHDRYEYPPPGLYCG